MADKTSLWLGKKPFPRLSTFSIALRASLSAMLLSLSAMPTHATTPPTAGSEWTTPSGTLEGTRYSGLTDITPANVATLKEEFSFPTGVNGSHQGGPLVVGKLMYAVTPYPNWLVAYDLSTGKTKWTYKPQISEYAKGVNCCDTVNRGAAYADGKIVYNLLDNTVIAVNANTGKLIWRNHLADPQTGVTMTAAPIIVNGRVIVGTSGGELGIRGSYTCRFFKKVWRDTTLR